jgi:chromosome segregation ATPase
MSSDDAKLFQAYQRMIDQAAKLAGANSKTSKESSEAAKKAKEEAAERAKAEREHIKMMERGKAMVESMRTPQEAYNAAVEDANELHQKGAIDAESLARKLQQLKNRLDEQTGVSARNAAVEKARLDVMAKNGQVTDRAAAAINKYEQELVELDKKQEAGTISAQELARAQAKVRSEFDESVGLADKQNGLVSLASSQLGQYATAAGAAAAAVGLIRSAWETVTAEQQKGLDALKATQDTSRALLQISDTPEDFASMRAEAQQLATQEGVDIATVERVMFSAVSEGFRDAVPDIIAANQIIAPEAAAGVAGQVPALFQGTIGALEAVDLTLKAARDSRLNFEDIARSLPGAAEGGAVAKASPEETLAVLSVLASRFKSGETAADRIKAFSAKAGIDAGDAGLTDEQLAEKREAEQSRVERETRALRTKEERVADLEKRMAGAGRGTDKEALQTQLDRARRDVAEFDRSKLEFQEPSRGETRESFAGMGIIKVVEKLDAMTAEQRAAYLKDSQELNTAYIALSEELPTIKARMEDIQKERADFAAGGGLLRERMDIAANDEELAALKSNAIETAKLEEAYRTGKGIEGAAADTATKATERVLLDDGTFGARVANQMGLAGNATRGAVAAGVDGGTATAIGAGAAEIVGGGGIAGFFGSVARAMADSAAAQSQATEAMNRAAAAQEAAAKRQPIPFKPATDAGRAQANLAREGT